MGKLREISGYTRATLDKLEGSLADLERLDNDRQAWGFPNLVETLNKWTERNPMPDSVRDKVFATNATYPHSTLCLLSVDKS